MAVVRRRRGGRGRGGRRSRAGRVVVGGSASERREREAVAIGTARSVARRGVRASSGAEPTRGAARPSIERRAGGRSLDFERCAGGSPSAATSRSRCRARAAATASTARSRRTARTCTRPTRSSRSSTAPRSAASRSCSSSPASARRSTRACARGSPSTATRTSSPTSRGRASARSSAACCRTRTSACSSREDLARLREVTASQGLMLESVNPDLVAHQGSPTKHPARRLETIAAAGELRIPFTSGILVGIGEREEERVAALEALAAVHAEHGHLQEVILQNFVPHDSYYGREPAEIADAAARERWATGIGDAAAPRAAALGHAGVDRRHAPPRRRVPAPDARRRRAGAAEPRRLVARARARRRDRSRRPERQRRSHLARAPVPVAARGPQAPGEPRASR